MSDWMKVLGTYFLYLYVPIKAFQILVLHKKD